MAGIGTVALINYHTLDNALVMEDYSIFFAIIGTNIVLCQSIMKIKVSFIKE
jgi:hypothetical protein